jgi:adenosine deaminase
MGGLEPGFPPELHEMAFDMVREAGIPAVVHAGETAGPVSIWGAVRELGAKRVGHGVRAVEDKELMEYLQKNGIILEVCPTSNICLGVYPDSRNHSLPKLIAAGLSVTINSDDPPMFNTTLTREYKLVSDVLGYGEAEF